MSLLKVNTITPLTGSIANISGSIEISGSLSLDGIDVQGNTILGNSITDTVQI